MPSKDHGKEEQFQHGHHCTDTALLALLLADISETPLHPYSSIFL